ncbi:MAG: hypothetical protein JO345_02010 [Streptosporangiaceae bacterium]|nr:hypothetical protein [Streptosporangiaceae bacterium]
MSAEPQLDMLTSRILTAEIQAELGIAPETIRPDGHFLRFRLDPGNLFERHGLLRDYLDDSYGLGISQRYRPHETLVGVAGASASIVDLPDQLRAAVTFARDRDAHLPHWLETRRRESPAWSIDYPPNDAAAASDATATTADRARDTGITHYLFTDHARVISGNNPPETGRFFSVTPAGDWSVHWETHTRPLSAAPQSAALTTGEARTPAQVARRDLPRSGPAVPERAGAVTPISTTYNERRLPRRRPAPGR